MITKLLQLAGQGRYLTVCLLLLGNAALQAQIPATRASDRMKSVEQRKLLQDRSLVNNVEFRNIGPSIMSGRVVDIDANPDNAAEFYVAYATGGLWYSNNNGQSFTPLFDSASVITIGDIAVNWKTGSIWVGSGEVNSSRSSYAGNGVYKSTDHGKTWTWLGLPESQHIGKIQLHPTNDNIAWVAVLGHLYSPNRERGVYKTTDGGKTWKQTLYVNDNTGVVDLDINPADPNTLYAAAWYRTRKAWNFEESGESSGLYKSTDGGETWVRINTPQSGFPSGAMVGRMGIAVYPKNPSTLFVVLDNQQAKPAKEGKKEVDTNYNKDDFKSLTVAQFAKLNDKQLDRFLRRNRFPSKYTAESVKELVTTGKVPPTAIYDYLDVDDGFSNTGIYGCQVYRSDDAGKTWKLANTKDIPIFSTYGYYFSKIYVSPYNDQKLIIVGVPVQLSTDGGKTFTSIDKANVHSDHHAIWIDPKDDNHFLDGNDGGLNITYDNGDHWFKANTPSVGQFYAIDVDDAKPYHVYGGLQDNGSWFGPSNNKESVNWTDEGEYAFKRVNGGDGMQIQVDRRDNSTVYSGSQFGVYARINTQKRGRKGIRPAHDLGEKPYRFNWQTPIVLSRHNQDILYYATNHLHRSMNQGDDMEVLSGDLTKGPKKGDVPFGTITSLSESPLHFGLLYAGTDDGNVQVSKDGGYNWTLISNSLPQDLYVTRVLASRFRESRVYVTLNGYRNDHFLPYLYVSDDYGATWKALHQGLPFEPLNVIKEDPKYDSILYVGSDGGLYVSIDAGQHFMSWNAGMPASIPVHDIAIQERENEIVLATHGRSIYIGKLDSVQVLLKSPDYRAKAKATAAERGQKMSDKAIAELFDRTNLNAPGAGMAEPPPADMKKRRRNPEGKN